VLDVCQFGDLSLCRRIATQLVGHDLAWHIGRRGKHALEKALGCSLIATLLQQPTSSSRTIGPSNAEPDRCSGSRTSTARASF
jgi:hypothetical protein